MESEVLFTVSEVADDAATHPRTSAEQIEAALERAYRGPLKPADPIPGQILAIAERIGIGPLALELWIQELGEAKRAAGYKITSPRLWLTAAGEDLIRWKREHAEMVNQCNQQEERDAERRATPIRQMPYTPPPEICPTCNEELNDHAECQSDLCRAQRAAARPRRTEAV